VSAGLDPSSRYNPALEVRLVQRDMAHQAQVFPVQNELKLFNQKERNLLTCIPALPYRLKKNRRIKHEQN
jgi:hypothetical protein